MAEMRILRDSLIFISLLTVTGCISPPSSKPSPAGIRAVSLLDADVEDARFALYLRRSDGVWLFGGGSKAAVGQASEVMSFQEADRRAVADLMTRAGWLEEDHVPEAGPGPRRLDVSLTGSGASRQFTIRADGRSFDPAVTALLVRLRAIADRRFSNVIEALPRARPTED